MKTEKWVWVRGVTVFVSTLLWAFLVLVPFVGSLLWVFLFGALVCSEISVGVAGRFVGVVVSSFLSFVVVTVGLLVLFGLRGRNILKGGLYASG